MPKSIVLEGPDGGGKSTVAQRLSSILKLPLLHTGGPKTKEDIHRTCSHTEAVSFYASYVFDRLPQISERVYAPALGRERLVSDEYLLNSLKTVNPVIVYCHLPDWKEMFLHQSRETKAHKPLEHTRDVKAHYEDIVKRYDDLMDELSKLMPVIRYSWKHDDYDGLVAQIKEHF